MNDDMTREERERIEKEIRENGIRGEDVAFSVKEIALLTWFTVDELKSDIREKYATKREVWTYLSWGGAAVMAMVVVAGVILTATI